MTEITSIVFVVDDDESVRESLENLLRSADFTVETFSSAREFLAHPAIDNPGCLILDVNLPDLDGLELQKKMAEIDLEIPIIFITGYGSIPMSVKAMKAGAFEFLTKPFSDRILLEAVEQAIFRNLSMRSRQAETMKIRRRYESLTAREKEVMELVVAGLLNKQIAYKLGISEITVKVHRAQVMQKMQAESLADLVRLSSNL